jgi:putative SOS response-associated peptidase YedK
MCGRLNLTASGSELAEIFGLDEIPNVSPRYNIAPMQPIAVVRVDPKGGRRRLDTLRWGLVPSWEKDPAVGNRMINARIESAASKPAFREAFQRHRCLIPTNGFYEWEDRNGVKQAFVIRRKDGHLFAFAGLWDRWDRGEPLETCTILTTEPNEVVRPIHDRMPLILPPEAYELWLDPREDKVGALKRLLGPTSVEDLVAVPISSRVNSPENDDPEVLEPITGPVSSAQPASSRQKSLW